MQTNSTEIAEVLVREFGLQGGIDYGEKIIQANGEDADRYRVAVDIIKRTLSRETRTKSRKGKGR